MTALLCRIILLCVLSLESFHYFSSKIIRCFSPNYGDSPHSNSGTISHYVICYRKYSVIYSWKYYVVYFTTHSVNRMNPLVIFRNARNKRMVKKRLSLRERIENVMFVEECGVMGKKEKNGLPSISCKTWVHEECCTFQGGELLCDLC